MTAVWILCWVGREDKRCVVALLTAIGQEKQAPVVHSKWSALSCGLETATKALSHRQILSKPVNAIPIFCAKKY
jgi:hypothetical protein